MTMKKHTTRIALALAAVGLAAACTVIRRCVH